MDSPPTHHPAQHHLVQLAQDPNVAAFPTEFESVAAHSPAAQSPFAQEPAIPVGAD